MNSRTQELTLARDLGKSLPRRKYLQDLEKSYKMTFKQDRLQDLAARFSYQLDAGNMNFWLYLARYKAKFRASKI